MLLKLILFAKVLLVDLQVAVALVDEMCGDFPPLIKDPTFDEGVTDLPYTNASLASKKPMFLGSTYNLT